MIPTRKEMEDALKERHGEHLQNIFSQSTVAICGLGGLGSNIAIALARAGIGKLILIDFDRVDISNLHRQQYKASQIGMYKTDALRKNLQEISPYLAITTYREKIREDNIEKLLAPAQIICEAFDSPTEKSMLVDKIFEKLPEKYVVAASGMAGLGSPNTIKTRRITSHFYLSGDETSDVSEGIGLISSRVMLCAAHQAHTVLRLLAKEENIL